MVDRDTLVEDLKTFAEKCGGSPTYIEMDNKGPWSASTYEKYFDSWNKALDEANLNKNQVKDVPNDQLISDLISFSEKIGEVPTMDEMDERGPWNSITYIRRFGSWNEALEVAKLGINFEKNVDKERLRSDLVEFAEGIDGVPTRDDMLEDGPWSTEPYVRVFGSWNSALRAVGLDPNSERDVSKSRLIDDLYKFSEKIGCVPSVSQMDQIGPRYVGVYVDRFGSWNNALRAAGLEPTVEYPIDAEWDEDIDDYYGGSWPKMREQALDRDGSECRVCGGDGLVHVHHIKPRRSFEEPDDSNTMDNLITLCTACHGTFERRWMECDHTQFESKAKSYLEQKSN